MAQSIPEGSFRSELSAVYNAHTIPRELRHGEILPPQTWGKVVVEEGELALKLGSPGTVTRIGAGQTGIIPPQTRFTCSDHGGPVLFHIEYFHEPRQNDSASLAAELGGRAR